MTQRHGRRDFLRTLDFNRQTDEDDDGVRRSSFKGADLSNATIKLPCLCAKNAYFGLKKPVSEASEYNNRPDTKGSSDITQVAKVDGKL